jgi:hypothetical protein
MGRQQLAGHPPRPKGGLRVAQRRRHADPQPARSLWQRVENLLFKLFPAEPVLSRMANRMKIPHAPSTCAGAPLLGLACSGRLRRLRAAARPRRRPGRASYRDLTTPFVAVGDTQEHESTGYPLHDNDSAVDAYVEVAQRPPEQPLFGRRILEWALQHHPDEPFVHLGDVMDLSCRVEAERMTRIFRAAGSPGAILPGNHDGLMFGIYGYNLLDAVLDPDAQALEQGLPARRGARGRAPQDRPTRPSASATSSTCTSPNTPRAGQVPGLQGAARAGRRMW